MSERLKILLAGMVAGDPHQGGASWAVLQYVAGLSELGHEVVLVEPVPAMSLDPAGEVVSCFRELPLIEGRAALLGQGTDRTCGLPYSQLLEFARDADLLLNISGMLRDEKLLEAPVRAFLDLDPGFNQVWQVTGSEMGFDLHTHFVTVGVRIGTEDCPIPTLERNWIGTLPPVSLPHWPMAEAAPERDSFTSVGHWRSYGSIEYGGVHYGQRAHSLRSLIELPTRSDTQFELALGIHPDEVGDLRALRENGWKLADPREVAGSPRVYASYVSGSQAELSVAKSGYVNSRSGWFSDRSACYLASGRPVVAQDTGFGDSLPVGEGLLSFESTRGAGDAVAEVRADIDRHRRAARELAEEHLDSRKVLSRLLESLAAPAGGGVGG
jgi:hypothetical protein